ncbi:hypothetical protein P7C70_g9558, partial [Phenoliferia sp. Uapishka_3]
YHAAGLLELNNVARLVDPEHWANRTSYGLIGLQALCARYLNQYLPKDPRIRCGAWGGPLSPEQKYCECFLFDRPLNSSAQNPSMIRSDGANDVYSSLKLYLFLASEASSDTNPLSLASSNLSTASSWRPPPSTTPNLMIPNKIPSCSNTADVISKPTPDSSRIRSPHPKVAHARPGIRALEAYQRWHVEATSPERVAHIMSLSRKIKPLSVM